jgi:hypothetical protein
VGGTHTTVEGYPRGVNESFARRDSSVMPAVYHLSGTKLLHNLRSARRLGDICVMRDSGMQLVATAEAASYILVITSR